MSVEQPPPDSPEGRVLSLLNAHRAHAGLAPVVLDATLDVGCRAHAEYLRLNRGRPEIYGLRAHDEDPSLPGATPAGRECGKNGDITEWSQTAEGAINLWVGTLYHRQPILAPELERIGVGYAQLGGIYIVVVEFVYGATRQAAVLYPMNGETNVPLYFTHETPNPLPPPTVDAGFPITLQASGALTNVVAELDDGVTQLPFFLSSPERPALAGWPNVGLIGLIPKEPLRPGTRYHAQISATWNGAPRTWSTAFTTAPQITVDPTNDDALVAANGAPVSMRGLVRAATYINEGLVIVTLERPVTTRIVQAQIETSPVGLGPAKQLHGKQIEAEGILHVEGASAKLTARTARVVE